MGAALVDLLTGWDLAALVVFFIAIYGLRHLIERSPENRPSTSNLMSRYRLAWMEQSPKRANRMVDASLMVNQRAGSAFFASGAMLAIGGVAALLGQADRLVDVAQDLVADAQIARRVWEMKLIFILLLVVDVFLKFVWAHRTIGYSAVLLGAMPEDGSDEEVKKAVERAASVNIIGARSFNRGLRGLYFSLAAMAWFLGAEAFIITVVFTSGVIYRREFLSRTREALL